MTVELGRDLPLEPGLGFAIREGGRTVGAGAGARGRCRQAVVRQSADGRSRQDT
jgi:hypothetical protein